VGLDSDLLCPGFVGVDDAAFDVLRVYPNPFTHAFTIDVPKSSDAQSFEVFSITGQMVLRGQLQAGTQSVLANELPNGMYVLRIFQATESYHFQIIKGL
jgi:hypothetical protein